MITIAHTFYNQHGMLGLHAQAWREHMSGHVNYLFIDDCSPRLLLCEGFNKAVEVYRIDRDISWNIAGARNLAYWVAATEWVFCGDMDHVVTNEALQGIMNLDLSDPRVVYTFKRRDKHGKFGCNSINNLLINRETFISLGGYDEDFSGNYGSEETFFGHCMRKRRLIIRMCENIVLMWRPDIGGTKVLKRNRETNRGIFNRKLVELKDGVYTSPQTLRFSWSQTSIDCRMNKLDK